MRPVLRRFLIGSAIVVSIVVIGVGWVALSMGSCDYRLIYHRPSPSDRYVAEVYGADCGMGSYFGVVMLRDVSALELPKLDGSPAGTVITDNFDTMDERGDVYWDGETTFVIQHRSANAPALDRTEWGGVRIETRRFEPQP